MRIIMYVTCRKLIYSGFSIFPNLLQYCVCLFYAFPCTRSYTALLVVGNILTFIDFLFYFIYFFKQMKIKGGSLY